MNNLKNLSFTRMTQFLQRKRIVCLFSVARACRFAYKQQTGPGGVARRVPSVTLGLRAGRLHMTSHIWREKVADQKL